MANYLNYRSGLSTAGAYQVAGIPYMSASAAVIPASSGTPYQVSFPSVTKWIVVENMSTGSLRVGYSELGVKGTSENAYFVLSTPGDHNLSRIELNVRVKDIYLLADVNDTTKAQISAGLTPVSTEELTGTINNWSGSSGVG